MANEKERKRTRSHANQIKTPNCPRQICSFQKTNCSLDIMPEVFYQTQVVKERGKKKSRAREDEADEIGVQYVYEDQVENLRLGAWKWSSSADRQTYPMSKHCCCPKSVTGPPPSIFTVRCSSSSGAVQPGWPNCSPSSGTHVQAVRQQWHGCARRRTGKRSRRT